MSASESIATAAAAASVLSTAAAKSSHVVSSASTAAATSITATATTEDKDTSTLSLSEDLALFLSNPSLRAALADGSLDLASYSNIVEEELQELESSCIRQYRDKAREILELKEHATECQTVLSALHEMLLGFQADLGGLSGDIRQLQEKSRTLDVQLKNRRLAEEGISRFLSKTVVAPNLAHAITTGPVNHGFLKAVQELQVLHDNCTLTTAQAWAADKAPSETAAGRELQTKIQTLRSLAVVRIREYFLQQMALLRRPQTNIRIIQVHGLLKYAALQDFLQEASPEIAQEIMNVYLESMSKTLLQLFRTYQAQLLQLDATKQAATRQDVIAIDDALLRDSLTTRAKKRVDLFCLGARASECLLLEESALPSTSSSSLPSPSTGANKRHSTAAGSGPSSMSAAAATGAATTTASATASATAAGNSNSTAPNVRPRPILAHVALAENQRYPYERLFRSLLGHLVDAVTNEHVFCRQFFKRDCFQPLFRQHGMTLSLLLEQLENYLFGCYDALCLLLMIKVTHAFRRIARNRQIHSLDPFFDQVTHLLWPRLKMIMEHHHRSIRQATAIKLGCTSSDNLQQHYVSRRFAEFCCSILLILHNNNTTIAASSNNIGSTSKQQTGSGSRLGSGSGSGSTLALSALKRSSSAASALPGSSSSPSSSPSSSSPDQTAAASANSTLSSPFAEKNKTHANVNHNRRKSTGNLLAGTTSSVSESGDNAQHQQQLPQQQTRLDGSTHSTSSLHKSAGDKLLEDLSAMVEDFVMLLERLAEEHDYSSQKLKTVFLINNLDHVVCIFQERRVVVGKEFNRFVELLMKQRELFVEEELLATGFSKMIAFVQQTEAHMATLSSSSSSTSTTSGRTAGTKTTMDIVNIQVVESLILDFASNWKHNVEQINRNVLSYFSNFRNGMEILKQCLTQLLLYYTRFQDIIRKVWRNQKPPAFCKDLVSTHVILAEIKKYALAI